LIELTEATAGHRGVVAAVDLLKRREGGREGGRSQESEERIGREGGREGRLTLAIW